MSEDVRSRIKRAFEAEIDPPAADLSTQVFAAIPVGVAVAPGLAGWLHNLIAYIAKHWLASTLIGIGVVAAAGYLLINRAPDVALYVAYVDRQPTRPGPIPNPWSGSSNVIFQGTGPPLDAGAVRLDNQGGSEITVDQIVVSIGGRRYALWPSGIKLPAHAVLILTQTGVVSQNPFQSNFDTSEARADSCSALSPDVPIIDVTVGGRHLIYRDTHLVLNTGGRDLGNCPGKPDESHPWEQLAASS